MAWIGHGVLCGSKPRGVKRCVLTACLVLAGCVAAVTPNAAGEAGGLSYEVLQGDARTGSLRYLGGLNLNGPSGFGGLSALDASVDGASLVAVTDSGAWFRMTPKYDSTGKLTGAALAAQGDLSEVGGRPLPGKAGADAEAMARLQDGRVVVAMEIRHRLLAFDNTEFADGERLASEPDMRGLPRNSGIEALTQLADGRLLAISEATRGGQAGQAWVGGVDSGTEGGGWIVRDYPVSGPFRPTGAATLANGDILVVERRASLTGLNARVMRIARDNAEGSGPLAPQVIGRLDASWDGPVDNFEGIAVAERDGETLVFLVSDDNFSLFQRTLLVVFALEG